MIGRLKEAVRGFAARFPRRGGYRPDSGGKEVIQGSAGNVIIVKSPNTEYFKEAIFILCDDLFARSGVNRKELMRQARRAACEYVCERVPPRELKALWNLFFYLLGALSALAAVALLKLA
jgi:hypothetical protein